MIFAKALVILLVMPIFINSETNKKENILLRKLKSLEDQQTTNDVKPPWNERIASLFLKSIELFSTSKITEDYSESVPPTQEKTPLLVRCFSEVLSIYKKYIFDKIWYRFPERDAALTIVTDPPASSDPKDDVEVIQPRYHGKLCEVEGCGNGNGNEITTKSTVEVNNENKKEDTEFHTTEMNKVLTNKEDVEVLTKTPKDDVEVLTEKHKVLVKREDTELQFGTICADGMVKDDKGNCVSKSQRFIFNVPNHCPFGYKKDRLGFCRPLW